MMKLRLFCLVALTQLMVLHTNAQTCPLELINTSGTIQDSEVYWAIIGQSPQNQWSYVNIATGQLIPLNAADNTMVDPNGKPGPGGHNPGKYSNYFYPFSTYKSVNLPQMHGTRIFITVGKPLYLYAFGPTGGYAGINHLNPDDPNQGILYEVIEFTLDQAGFHGNTTRVDEFSFPISMQVQGADGYNRFVGEYKDYQTLFDGFKAFVSAPFQGCVSGKMIKAPGKSVFNVGGPQQNYFDQYINTLWTKYASQDLVFKTEIGTFKGRVYGQEFRFIRQSDQAVATISRKPSTIEIFEGSGCLAQDNGHGSFDLVVQAMFCASVNRGMVEHADWTKVQDFYKTNPCNEYSKYWHSEGVSYGNLAYGFCYDDVFGQSTLLEHANPTKITIRLGGGGTDDITGGLKLAGDKKPNIGGTTGACTGTAITSGGAQNFSYSYSFIPNGNSVTVTLNAVQNMVGLVSVIQNLSGSYVEEKIVEGKEVSQTFTGNAGDKLVIKGKWLYPGGDTWSKEFVYEIGSACNITNIDVMNNEKTQLNLFAQDGLVRVVSSKKIERINVFNIHGQLLFTAVTNTLSYTLPKTLEQGLYLIETNLGDEKITRKVIVK